MTYTLDPDLLLVRLLVFSSTPSSYLTACCALLLGIDVDGCLVDACEGVVSGIVSGKSNIQINVTFKIQINYIPLRRWKLLPLDTHTEQYGLFLWLTKLLAVSTILQTSQWKQALCQFWEREKKDMWFHEQAVDRVKRGYMLMVFFYDVVHYLAFLNRMISCLQSFSTALVN